MSGVTYSWMTKAVPDRETVVVRYVLERLANEAADQPFLVFEDGSLWCYGDTVTRIKRYASGLARAGVKQGDRVLCWLPNCPECVLAWLAINWLGATYVPINIAYKGSLLEHVVNNSGASLILTQTDLVSRLHDITAEKLTTAILCDRDAVPESELSGPLRILDRSALAPDIDETLLALEHPIEPWDEQSIIYTSGTTGPSKGVMSSYCHSATTALVSFEGKDAPDFRYMLTLPLFHAGGTIGVLGPLLLGRSVTLVERFDTKKFWALINRTQSTCCTLLGAMATFLVKQEDSEESRRNTLQWAYIIPFTEDGIAFSRRFSVDAYTMFNMTETSVPIVSDKNPVTPGACGHLRPGVEGRLVDEHDCEVADDEGGELILRTNRPWSMNHGYNDNPEATAAAWRNGWFHTGDMFRRLPSGEYVFVDRRKDAIRRRGENISSFEVERDCVSYPQVREAAAFGVASAYSEQDVMVVVSLVEGANIDYTEFFEYLKDRMPYFMLPRYIRVVEDIPKTPTQKIMKAELRKEGVTKDTWDREAHGIVVKSDYARKTETGGR